MAFNLFYFFFLGVLVNSCRGHGQMDEPPSRASAWRFGFDTPINYNDHELFCGGLHRLWGVNNGKCGICGDPWDSPEPRKYEIGGKMTTGAIVRMYRANDVIPVNIRLTAAHKGYWEIRLCTNPLDGTEGCFKHVLELTTGGTKFHPEGSRTYSLTYKLPSNISCDHCVISWWYKAGNNWGVCEDGTGALGCGKQEYFRGCADVTILPGEGAAIVETEATFLEVQNTITPEETLIETPSVPTHQHTTGPLVSSTSTTEKVLHTSTDKTNEPLQLSYPLSVLKSVADKTKDTPLPVVKAFGSISSLAGAIKKGNELSPNKPYILQLFLLVNDATV